ncbi:hypothetical protein FA95DRAFT_758825 [Auriscalpium vulgare]|uniref:Uncharacterized protein n=1 Tax=Auriscalpium vulgare TaxID=40419 RepID=A0ACB8S1D3_9AGAM|nr:hypothetical protein FA95DRAFT_758825 [Auriscalpium vulgare]
MRATTLFLSSALLVVARLVTAAPVLRISHGERGLLDTVEDDAEEVFDVCPTYNEADAADISARNLEMEKRAGEEFWFRFEDPSIITSGSILQLAAHAKNFDDQAYKWISNDISKVTRAGIKGRVPTMYVLPAGTRAQVVAAAQKFEETSEAQKPADFVTKDNEPNDIGINGVAQNADGVLPLDDFRSKVIRTVVLQKSTKAKGKTTFTTITKGKSATGASQADQKVMNKACSN